MKKIFHLLLSLLGFIFLSGSNTCSKFYVDFNHIVGALASEKLASHRFHSVLTTPKYQSLLAYLLNKAPRPPLPIGGLSDIGDQYQPELLPFILPSDLTIANDLTVLHDTTVGNNLTVQNNAYINQSLSVGTQLELHEPGGTEKIILHAPNTLTGNYTLTLPTSAGTNGYALTTNGFGVLSWSNVAPAGSYFVNGGNNFGANSSLGLNDNYSLSIETNNTPRIMVASGFTGGGVTITGDATLNSNLYISNSNGKIYKEGIEFIHTTNGVTNIYIGNRVGNDDGSSSNNTGLGQELLNSVSGGRENITLGYNNLQNLRDGRNNIALGSSILDRADSIESNIGIGQYCLENFSGGTNNIAIGQNTMQNLREGSHNVAIGFEALLGSGNVGTNNIAIGYQTLRNCESNGYNVALGYTTGTAITGGESNVMIGNSTAASLTKGYNNVLIGLNAGNRYDDGENENICIGSNVVGSTGEERTTRLGSTDQKACFIGGIRDIAVVDHPVDVIIDANGQLGTIPSAQRFKTNIVDAISNPATFKQLRPVTFTYIDDTSNITHHGFIAEEVAPLYPELIVYDKENVIYSVNYRELFGILVKELQTALLRIEALEAQ